MELQHVKLYYLEIKAQPNKTTVNTVVFVW